MKMTWWKEFSSDQQNAFIDYLKKIGKLGNNPPIKHLGAVQHFGNPRLISQLIIPILEEGDGYIPEDLDRVVALQQNWGMTNFKLVKEIYTLYERMINPLTTNKASIITNFTPRRLRHLASTKVFYAIKKRNRWIFTREELIDLIV